MLRAWEHDAEAAWKVAAALREFASACSERLARMPRMGRQAKSVGEAEEAVLLRAAWTLAYWCGNEYADVHRFGFGDVADAVVRDFVDDLLQRVVAQENAA